MQSFKSIHSTPGTRKQVCLIQVGWSERVLEKSWHPFWPKGIIAPLFQVLIGHFTSSGDHGEAAMLPSLLGSWNRGWKKKKNWQNMCQRGYFCVLHKKKQPIARIIKDQMQVHFEMWKQEERHTERSSGVISPPPPPQIEYDFRHVKVTPVSSWASPRLFSLCNLSLF